MRGFTDGISLPLSLRRPLRLLLTPELVVLCRGSSGGSSRSPSISRRARDVVEERASSGAWAAEEALAAAARLLDGTPAGGALEVVFSDLWVRYATVAVQTGMLSEEELLALAAAKLGAQFPETASWEKRVAQCGAQLFAVATAPALLDGIRHAAGARRLRLRRVEPLFPHGFDARGALIKSWSGWLMLLEPGMACVARVEQGALAGWHGQRCQRGDSREVVAALLERGHALFPDVQKSVQLLYTPGAAPVALPESWTLACQAPLLPELGAAHP